MPTGKNQICEWDDGEEIGNTNKYNGQLNVTYRSATEGCSPKPLTKCYEIQQYNFQKLWSSFTNNV